MSEEIGDEKETSVRKHEGRKESHFSGLVPSRCRRTNIVRFDGCCMFLCGVSLWPCPDSLLPLSFLRQSLCSSLEMRYWPKRRRRHIIGRQKCSRRRDRQLEAASEREGEGELLLDLYFLPLLLLSHPLPSHAFCLATRVHLPLPPLLFSSLVSWGLMWCGRRRRGRTNKRQKSNTAPPRPSELRSLCTSLLSARRGEEHDVDATPSLQSFQTCAKKSSLSASNNSLPL